MHPLIQLFLDITLLRKGPQDTPASPWLLRVLAGLYLGVNFLILALNQYDGAALPQVAVDFLLLLGFTWPLLYFSGKKARFMQTLIALTGTDIIISALLLPFAASRELLPPELIFFAMLVLMGWHWIVYGHIYRHALDRPIFFGLGLSLLYVLISSQILELLFPVLTSHS